MNDKILGKLPWLVLTLILMFQQAVGQSLSETIEVTFSKTTTVVFACDIAAVDRGSRDVLVQKAKGVNNVLQLKAAKEDFDETNLTVITADGQIHHYFVRYAKRPSTFVILATARPFQGRLKASFAEGASKSHLEASAKKILRLNKKRRIKRATRFEMTLSVEGIYVEGSMMYYHLRVTNKSNIPFFTEVLQFSIVDRQQVKRTAFQQVVKEPLFQSANYDCIDPKTSLELILAFPAFTVSEAKALSIDMHERGSGRSVSLRLVNRKLVRALEL